MLIFYIMLSLIIGSAGIYSFTVDRPILGGILIVIAGLVTITNYFRLKGIEKQNIRKSGVTFITSSEDLEEDYNPNYWIPVESKRRSVQIPLHLTYEKTNFEKTERDFDLQSFSRGEKGYHFHGFCKKRQRNITLSSLGISNVTDLNTGEIIDDLIAYVELKYGGVDKV